MPNEHHIHLSYAQEALRIVNARFPNGAADIFENVLRKNASVKEIYQHFSAFERFSHDEERNPMLMAQGLHTLSWGSASLFASYALGFLKGKYGHLESPCSFECMYIDQKHAALVIGRDAESDPFQIETWGDHAYICDIWAGSIYLASEFFNKQRNEPNIRKCEVLVKLENGMPSYISLKEESHYLHGQPKIFTTPASLEYDEFLKQWVILDQASRPPAPRAPQFALTSPKLTTQERREIYSIFNHISEMNGWKITETTGLTVWRDCASMAEARRSAALLTAVDAMKVSLERRKDNHQPVVVCKDIAKEKLWGYLPQTTDSINETLSNTPK